MTPDKPMEIVIAAAAKKLGEIYPNIKVYTEQVKQGLPEEAFVLFCIPATNRKVTNVRYQMTGTLDIAYIIRDDSDESLLKELFAEKYQTISTSLTTIRFGKNKIRLTEFSYQEADNVLHILGNFTIQYFVTEENDG